MNRPSWEEYYLDVALAVSRRSTCLRRRYGAVIVKDNSIISTGYNGSPKGEVNCCDKGMCKRNLLGFKKGEGYEYCPAVHAEMNAIIRANYQDMKDSTLYICGMEFEDLEYADSEPCYLCERLIKNSGIKWIVWRDKLGHIFRRTVDTIPNVQGK